MAIRWPSAWPAPGRLLRSRPAALLQGAPDCDWPPFWGAAGSQEVAGHDIRPAACGPQGRCHVPRFFFCGGAGGPSASEGGRAPRRMLSGGALVACCRLAFPALRRSGRGDGRGPAGGRAATERRTGGGARRGAASTRRALGQVCSRRGNKPVRGAPQCVKFDVFSKTSNLTRALRC